jgi:hypothetical protein
MIKKTENIKKYDGVYTLLAEIRKDRLSHPIKYALSCAYHRTIAFFEDTIIRNTKAFIQRGRRGYADCDVWNFDGYLCDVIVGGLKDLRKHHSGCPTEIYEECKHNDQATKKEWNHRLDQMIEGFIAGRKIINLDYNWRNKKAGTILKLKYNRGMRLFTEHFFSLWD